MEEEGFLLSLLSVELAVVNVLLLSITVSFESSACSLLLNSRGGSFQLPVLEQTLGDLPLCPGHGLQEVVWLWKNISA